MREQKCTAIPPLKQKNEECIILQAPAEASTNMVLTKNFLIPNDTELTNGFRHNNRDPLVVLLAPSHQEHIQYSHFPYSHTPFSKRKDIQMCPKNYNKNMNG